MGGSLESGCLGKSQCYLLVSKHLLVFFSVELPKPAFISQLEAEERAFSQDLKKEENTAGNAQSYFTQHITCALYSTVETPFLFGLC